MTDSIEVSRCVAARGYTEKQYGTLLPHTPQALEGRMLHIFATPLSRGVRDKPLELTSIAGGFATNSSDRAFRHPFGSAATTERLQMEHFTPSYMGRPGYPACCRCHSSRHALQSYYRSKRSSQAH